MTPKSCKLRVYTNGHRFFRGSQYCSDINTFPAGLTNKFYFVWSPGGEVKTSPQMKSKPSSAHCCSSKTQLSMVSRCPESKAEQAWPRSSSRLTAWTSTRSCQRSRSNFRRTPDLCFSDLWHVSTSPARSKWRRSRCRRRVSTRIISRQVLL